MRTLPTFYLMVVSIITCKSVSGLGFSGTCLYSVVNKNIKVLLVKSVLFVRLLMCIYICFCSEDKHLA